MGFAMKSTGMGLVEAMRILGWEDRDSVPPAVRSEAARVLYEHLLHIAKYRRRNEMISYEFEQHSEDCIQTVIVRFLTRQSPLHGVPPDSEPKARGYLIRCLRNVFLSRIRAARSEERKCAALRREMIAGRSRTRRALESKDNPTYAEDEDLALVRTSEQVGGEPSVEDFNSKWAVEASRDYEEDTDEVGSDDDGFSRSMDEEPHGLSGRTDDGGDLPTLLERLTNLLIRNASARLPEVDESFERNVHRFAKVILDTARTMRTESARRIFTESTARLLRCALGDTTIEREISSLERMKDGQATEEDEAARRRLRARLDQQHHRALERILERCLEAGMDPDWARRFVAALSLRGADRSGPGEVSESQDTATS